jgi:hypothetical protein
MSVTKLKPAKTPPMRLPATQFWGLCVVIFMVMQIPFVRVPVMFLSTWSHELGHGLGAMMTGGEFYKLTIYPNFSGLAQTASLSTFSRAATVIVGLMGPTILGVIMIFMTRALSAYRFTLLLLAALLALSLFRAADGFTFITLSVSAGLFALAGWRLPHRVLLYVTTIIAIALCLNALTSFGYFFIGGGEVGGRLYRSDTGVLADLWFGPHWLWGLLLAFFSILILFSGVILSDRWARKRSP